MLGLTPKLATPVDVGAALGHFLGPEAATRHAGALAALQGLRTRALSPTGDDASDGAREALQEYRAHLPALMARLPQSGVDAAKLVFSWTDTLRPYRAPLPRASLDYENACVLFNEATLVSRIAAKAAMRKTTEERKKAVKGFMEAASIFVFLRDSIMCRCVPRAPARASARSVTNPRPPVQAHW